MFAKILFPVNATRESREAAELVAEMAKIHNSQLHILTVVEESADELDPAHSPEAMARLLEEVKAFFTKAGLSAEGQERQGLPAFVICDVADELNVDLIIMGSRGMGLIEDGASESVSNRVINLSPCPVLIVP